MMRALLQGLLLAAATLIPLLAAGPAGSQPLFAPDATARLDEALGRLLVAGNVPSVAVGVMIPGKGTYLFARGTADLRTGSSRTIGQPFRIASLTKTFVATAVLQLVDRGVLAKTDTVARWFPDFPQAAITTIDDLLRMRSGIAAPSDEEITDKLYDNPTAPAASLTEMMRQSAALAAKFKPPNTEGVYTNLNYYMLAGIVERATGTGIGAFITDNIIQPLALGQTSYPTANELPGGLRGYSWNAALGRFEDKTLFNPAQGGAAGAMTSSIGDLLVYVRALCTGTLLKPETQDARMAGQVLAGTQVSYGEGLISNAGFCGHSGTVPGFNTDMYYVEHLGASLIVSVNRLDRDNAPHTGPFRAVVSEALTAQFGK